MSSVVHTPIKHTTLLAVSKISLRTRLKKLPTLSATKRPNYNTRIPHASQEDGVKKRLDFNLIRRNNKKHNRFQDVAEKKVAIIAKCVLQASRKKGVIQDLVIFIFTIFETKI